MTDNEKVLTEGLSSEGIKRDKHPFWYPPVGAGAYDASHPDVLKVMNSLTETLEVFAPRKGRHIKWYTCGPTVYDMSHMGHARAYLTFDILRRIIEDYFGYSIQYQMNITDIDDKIIKKARVNKLLHDYRQELDHSLILLTIFVDKAVKFAEDGLTKEEGCLNEPLPPNANSRVHDQREEKRKELELKCEQLKETKENITAVKQNFEELFEAASGVIGELLDKQKGDSIIDQSIFETHARKYEALFFKDMHRLGIRDPDIITRVTEYVPEVLNFIQGIMDNGFAYKAESSIFFDTDAFIKAGHSYPKLKPTSDGIKDETTEAEMAEGEGVLTTTIKGEKRSPNDFALWKFSKPGEPRWDSPWGPGRPGWHIECSVMANDVLGEDLDIHAGGWDLKFPHHDNECAQSEAYSCKCQWVNYFFHCGHLHIKGLKMSKSLKNFITIQQAFDDLGVTSRQMRLLFLMNNWNKPMNFSDQSLGAAKEQERILRAFFGSVDAVLRNESLKPIQHMNKHDSALYDKWREVESAVHRALCDNFNTPLVMQHLMVLVRYMNEYLLNQERSLPTLLRKVTLYITRILKVFGVIQGADDIGLDVAAQSNTVDDKMVAVIDAAVAFRDKVRWSIRDKKEPRDILRFCDELRDEEFARLGVRLEDNSIGSPTVWKSEDPEILTREAQKRNTDILEDRITKLQKKLEIKKKEHDDFMNLQYYSEHGLPELNDRGHPITKKQKEKLQKEIEEYAAQSEDEKEKHLANLNDEIQGLKEKIQKLSFDL